MFANCDDVFFLWAEPIWWQKIKPWNKFEFIFHNSDFILQTPRLYLTTLIRKINSSFSLLSLYPTLLPLVFLTTVFYKNYEHSDSDIQTIHCISYSVDFPRFPPLVPGCFCHHIHASDVTVTSTRYRSISGIHGVFSM